MSIDRKFKICYNTLTSRKVKIINMKCLRCNAEMNHYPCEINFKIFGVKHKPHPFAPQTQTSHNPHSVYICDKCGYIEFSTKDCEKPDI